MRTTVRLDEELLRRAKRRAADTGRTLNAVIEDALRAALAGPRGRAVREPAQMPISPKRGGVMPGVDLDDTASLYDLMDRRP